LHRSLTQSLISVAAYTPNSIKVALGIGELGIGKLLFGGYSTKALHCVPFPNAQCPNANDQLPKQPFFELGT